MIRSKDYQFPTNSGKRLLNRYVFGWTNGGNALELLMRALGQVLVPQ